MYNVSLIYVLERISQELNGQKEEIKSPDLYSISTCIDYWRCNAVQMLSPASDLLRQ